MKQLNMADAGMDGPPARNRTLPAIETHWSRILYFDMFAPASDERARKRHQQRRKARAIRDALGELDDRTLRDLGFHRSEIGSIAPEMTAQAEPTGATIPRRVPESAESVSGVTGGNAPNSAIRRPGLHGHATEPAYETSISRVAVAFAALAMAAVTISCFVIIPARIEDGVYDAGMVAGSKIGPVSSLGATMRRLVSTCHLVGAKFRPWL